MCEYMKVENNVYMYVDKGRQTKMGDHKTIDFFENHCRVIVIKIK